MLLSGVIVQYMGHLPAGIVLDEPQVVRNLRKAVRLYCGYATLRNAPSASEMYAAAQVAQGLPAPLIPVGDVHSPIDEIDEISGDQDFDVTASELAIIRPLFELYNEFENAQSLEATRSLGLDVYGRSTSEIEGDIKEREENMPSVCFMEPVVSI